MPKKLNTKKSPLKKPASQKTTKKLQKSPSSKLTMKQPSKKKPEEKKQSPRFLPRKNKTIQSGPPPTLFELDTTANEIMKRVRETLFPHKLTVENLSSRHKNHAQAKGKGGHYALEVISDMFAGLSILQRQQWIYRLVVDLLDAKKIHALQLTLKSPQEVVL